MLLWERSQKKVNYWIQQNRNTEITSPRITSSTYNSQSKVSDYSLYREQLGSIYWKGIYIYIYIYIYISTNHFLVILFILVICKCLIIVTTIYVFNITLQSLFLMSFFSIYNNNHLFAYSYMVSSVPIQ